MQGGTNVFPYYVVLSLESNEGNAPIGVVKTSETDPPSYDDILRWQLETQDAISFSSIEARVTFFARVAE